jgi:dihydroorotase
MLTDDEVRSYDPVFKVNPPLRSAADVEAVRHAVADGTIDVIATDHAPHPREDKDCEWAAAAMGMTGLETALAVVQAALVDTGLMDWAAVARRMSAAPAAVGRLDDPRLGLGRHGGRIAVGEPAHLTLHDPAAPWSPDPAALVSSGRNTPFAGRVLPGRPVATFLRGVATSLSGRPVDDPRAGAARPLALVGGPA